MSSFQEYDVQFFTATILEWKHLLMPDKYKEIIASSLQFMVDKERAYVNAFVIMSNHVHILWSIRGPHKREDIQRDFLKYTAQQIKFDLLANDPSTLNDYKVYAKDRTYQFWERRPLSVPIWTETVLLQKLEYVHNNPVKAGLCAIAADYKYSSALFYETGDDTFKFLSHYKY